ncbi:MAG: AAA family ATPase, partial [Oligoflexales bacterium]|nr:AAA family ATPase [Oligoflexales bacterium]
LSQIIPHFPPTLSEIISKLIRKQPEDRYATAFGLFEDLKRCRDDIARGDINNHFALGLKDIRRELNYRIPMVGRSNYIKKLDDHLKNAEAGKGSVLLIEAPSGVGKTRLAREFLTYAAEQHKFSTLRVKFTELEQNIPLSALERAMKYVQEMMSRIDSRTKENWHKLLVGSLAGRGQLITKKFPYLASYLPEFPQFGKVDPDTEEAILLETLVDFIPHIFGPDRKLIILFDDMQWADDFSLKLIKTMIKRSQQISLGCCFVIGTFRSEESKAVNEVLIPHIPKINHISLELLDERDSGYLMELLLEESGIEVDKLKSIAYDITQGNPFYIYEFVNAAIKNGLFRMVENGKWVFDENQLVKGNFSDSVTDLVTSRIKKISRDAYYALSTASVVGNTIPIKFLRKLLKKFHEKNKIYPIGTKDITYLDRALDELQHHHLIWPNEDQLVFFHDRIRALTYATLSEDEKKFIHEEYSNILHETYFCEDGLPHQEDENADAKILFEAAFHIQKSLPTRNPARSRNILKLAGQRALELFVYQRAKEYLKDCSTLYPRDFGEIIKGGLLEEYCATQECLADALALSEEIKQAILIYNFLLDHNEIPEKRAAIYHKLSNNHLFLFQYEQSIRSGKLGLRELKVKFWNSELLSLIFSILIFPFFLIFLLWYRFFGKQIHEIKSERENLLWNLKIGLQIPQYFTKPITAIASHIPYTIKLLSYKDNKYRAMAIVYWGIAAAVFGFDRISRYCYKKGLDYFKKNYNPVSYSFTLMTMGYLLDFSQGRLKAAESKIQEALRIATNTGETFTRFISYIGLIHIDYYGGDTGQSEDAIEELDRFWRKTGFVATAHGCRLRSSVLHNNILDTNAWIHLVVESANEIQSRGFDTLDVIYAYLGPAESYLLLDEPS